MKNRPHPVYNEKYCWTFLNIIAYLATEKEQEEINLLLYSHLSHTFQEQLKAPANHTLLQDYTV